MFKKILLLLKIISLSFGHHYHGGSITAKYLNRSSSGNHFLQLTFYFVWSYSDYKCNDFIIQKHELIGPYNDYVYLKNGRRITTCEVYCEKYSYKDNWSSGKKSLIYETNEDLIQIYYENCCWENLKANGLNWQLKFKMNLTEPNQSPQITVQPIITLRNDIRSVIPLNPLDPNDFDLIRCRWSLAELGECGGICHSIINSTLNDTSCEFIIESGMLSDTYGVAIQIEDFHDNPQSIAKSSVPIQFLLKLIEPTKAMKNCIKIPEFLQDEYDIYGVPYYQILQLKFRVKANCEVAIKKVEFIGVNELNISSIVKNNQTTNEYYVDVSWRPTPYNSQLYNQICATASDEYLLYAYKCVTVLAGHTAPEPLFATTLPNLTLYYRDIGGLNGTLMKWSVEFDKPIEKSLIGAKIRIFSTISSSKVYYEIDSSSDMAKTNGRKLEFLSNNTFESGTYYILFDYGIVQDSQFARLKSLSQNNETKWTFSVDLVANIAPYFETNTRKPYGSITHETFIGGLNKDNFIRFEISANRNITKNNLWTNLSICIYTQNRTLVTRLNTSDSNVTVAGSTLYFQVENILFSTGDYYVTIDQGVAIDAKVNYLLTNEIINETRWKFNINIKELSPTFNITGNPKGLVVYDEFKGDSNKIKWSVQAIYPIKKTFSNDTFIRIFDYNGTEVKQIQASSTNVNVTGNTLEFITNNQFKNGSYYILLDSDVVRDAVAQHLTSNELTSSVLWQFDINIPYLSPEFYLNTAIPQGLIEYETLKGDTNNQIDFSIISNREILYSPNQTKIVITGPYNYEIPVNNITVSLNNSKQICFKTPNWWFNSSGTYKITLQKGLFVDSNVMFLDTIELSTWEIFINITYLSPSFDLNSASPKSNLSLTTFRGTDNFIHWSVSSSKALSSSNFLDRTVTVMGPNSIQYQIYASNSNISASGNNLTFITPNSWFNRSGFYEIKFDMGLAIDKNIDFLQSNNFSGWIFYIDINYLSPTFIQSTARPTGTLNLTTFRGLSNNISFSIQSDQEIKKYTSNAKINVIKPSGAIVSLSLNDYTVNNNYLLNFSIPNSNFVTTGYYAINIDFGLVTDLYADVLVSQSSNWSIYIDLPSLSPKFIQSTARPTGTLNLTTFRGLSNNISFSIQSDQEIKKYTSNAKINVIKPSGAIVSLSLNDYTVNNNYLLNFSIPNSIFDKTGYYAINIDFGLVTDLYADVLVSQSSNWSIYIDLPSLSPSFIQSTALPTGTLDLTTFRGLSNNISFSIQSDQEIKKYTSNAKINVIKPSGAIVSLSLNDYTVNNNYLLNFSIPNSIFDKTGYYAINIDFGLVTDLYADVLVSQSSNWSIYIDLPSLSPSFIQSTALPTGTLDLTTFRGLSNNISFSIQSDQEIKKYTSNAKINVIKPSGAIVTLSLNDYTVNNNYSLNFTIPNSKFDTTGYYLINIDFGLVADLYADVLVSQSSNWSIYIDLPSLSPSFNQSTARPTSVIQKSHVVNAQVTFTIETLDLRSVVSRTGSFINIIESSSGFIRLSITSSVYTIINSNKLNFTINLNSIVYYTNFYITINQGIVTDSSIYFLHSNAMNNPAAWMFTLDKTVLAPVFTSKSPNAIIMNSSYTNSITWTVTTDVKIIKCIDYTKQIRINYISGFIFESISCDSLKIASDNKGFNFTSYEPYSTGPYYITFDNGIVCDYYVNSICSLVQYSSLFWNFTYMS